MKRLLTWLTSSHRHLHLVAGAAATVATLILPPIPPCHAALVTVILASALELKDVQWHGRWDWTDWLITIAGGAIAFALLFKFI